MSRKYNGVIFDMGGVMVQFKNLDNVATLIEQIRGNPEQYAKFVACELGEIPISEIADFVDIAFPGIKDVEDYENLQPKEYFGTVNKDIYLAAKKIQENGLKVGILSNNFYLSSANKRTAAIPEVYEFDDVVESCIVKMRKPEANIYKLSVSNLGLKPSECIFVDDLESNVKGAIGAGLKGIYLKDGNTNAVIEELEQLLNLNLK